MQQIGETREPMAVDCWEDAQRIAHKYAEEFKKDFWIMYAAKPHVQDRRAIIAGWEISIKRPPQGMLGVLVFKWDNTDRRLSVDTDLSLPYDVPISEVEMSKQEKDYIPTIAEAAKKSNSILLA